MNSNKIPSLNKWACTFNRHMTRTVFGIILYDRSGIDIQEIPREALVIVMFISHQSYPFHLLAIHTVCGDQPS